MMYGSETFLHVCTRAQSAGRSDYHTIFSCIDIPENILTVFRFRLWSENNFLCRNPLCDQLIPNVVIDGEIPSIRVDGYI